MTRSVVEKSESRNHATHILALNCKAEEHLVTGICELRVGCEHQSQRVAVLLSDILV